MSTSPLVRRLFLALLAVALPACGAGGGAVGNNTGGGPQQLTITTVALPGGSTGVAYQATLAAAGAQGPVTWSLSSGSLPPGLDLDAGSGVLSGTPGANGVFPFEVTATDTVTSDAQALSISIGDLALQATAGLTFGDAWTGRAVTLTASGRTGSVTFSVVSNESGGSLGNVNGSAGTATWTPGATGGATITDRLRVTDAGGGRTAELDLDVMVHPTAGYAAEFGASDVWWLDATGKFGSHAFATDFHKGLADVGLRRPQSTDATGTEADQLAALWFLVELRRQLNPMFLRNADGSEGTGLAITFPMEEPGAGYTKPAPADWVSGSPTRYSQMGFTHGSDDGVIGTAFLDGNSNGSHENDTSAGNSELGVFLNQVTPVFNSAYANTLDDNPVSSSDIEALKALLYELPNPGGRYLLLRSVGRGFARTVAAVVAHEVGHSLGLDHTDPPQTGSIMNPSALISPAATYSFTSADINQLQGGLPGLGKSASNLTATQKAATPAASGPGLRVCRCRARTSTR